MNRLKGLIWKAYKTRLRSPLATALDVGGPILLVLIYLCLKFILGSLAINMASEAQTTSYFRAIDRERTLEIKNTLGNHLCTKMLFHSQIPANSAPLKAAIEGQCGLELTEMSSREEMIQKLQTELDDRIAFRKADTDLSRWTGSFGCVWMIHKDRPSFHVGLLITSEGNLEIYDTESAGTSALFQPYTQGSTYNEYKFTASDLSSGMYVLNLCLSWVLSGQPLNASIEDPYIMRLKPLPAPASPIIVPTLFMVFFLAANFCNAMSTVIRISEENENGIHHYIRLSGVPASVYWSSQILVSVIQNIIQSLVLATLLAIPTNSNLFDPIQEANITFRWLLIVSYSFSLCAHAVFIASLFDRSSHAVLVTSLLGVGYSMYPFFFMIQWTPYTFSTLSPLNNLMLFNPVSNYQALLMVFFSVSMQTNQPLQFSHLTEKIIGGGMTDWSLGALWLWLIVQGFLWYAATILFDHIFYSSSRNPLLLLKNSCQDLFFIHSCMPFARPQSQLGPRSKSNKTVKSSLKSSHTLTTLDPNRICCSVRRLSITGPKVMMPQTNGNPLKLEHEQLKQLRLVIEENKSSITQRYMINRSHHKRSYLRSQINSDKAPLTLEETFRRNITWHETQFSLNELDLDFRYNQVSFILGSTDLKELLFESILGLKTFNSGGIVVDGSTFTRNTVSFARPHIGYLGERDIFLNEMNIYDNLQFFGSLRAPYYTEFESESLFLLSLLHLKSRKRDFPSVLTSRSARKLALAVACVGQTKLLLLVEPTLGLRWRPRCHVLNLLKKYKSIRSIVVDTSDIDEATAFGDRVLLLRNGKADLDGQPAHLAKVLNCGHWFILEPTFSGNLEEKGLPIANVLALETLTSSLFKEDKLGKLVIVDRPMDTLTSFGSNASSTGIDIAALRKELDKKQTRKAILLKINQSSSSIGAICIFLRMFVNNKRVHGFHLAEMNFESLEDVLVLRMSQAIYPNLPADLLISIPRGTIMDPDDDQAQISTRRFSSDIRGPPKLAPIHGGSILGIIKDRLSNRMELLAILVSMVAALVIVSLALMGLRMSLETESTRDLNKVEYSDIDKLYENRIAFYLVDNNTNPIGNESLINKYLDKWELNQNIKGSVSKQNLRGTDADFVAKVMQSSRDLAVSVIFYDYQTQAGTVAFEPQANHALLAGMRALINYKLKLLKSNLSSSSPLPGISPQFKTTQFNFNRPWMEIVRGHFNRRFFYGFGFSLAEGIAIGALVFSPIRHRSEFRIIKVRATYLTGMALFDFFISLFLVAGYVLIMMLIEGTHQSSLISSTFFILALYKLASIPIAYLVSLMVESGLNGFLFMVLIYSTYGWCFSIHFRTFVEWTLIDEGLIYTISSWIIYMFPVSSLVNALSNINHVGRIDTLCPKIPIHTPVSFLIVEEFEQKNNIISDLMKKVEECLMSGKKGISIAMMQQGPFGILWNLYLIVVFGAILWSFLICSDRVYGLVSKKYNSTRTNSRRIMNTRRVESPLHDIFKWDKERDRLVSEYVRSLNDPNYVRQMNSNCFYLRLWLKPISDQSANDIVKLTEPIITLGEKVEIRMELKTTLQLFIRVGDEKRKCPVNRTQIIEAYSKFVTLNHDSVTKFALVDWTRETLYKIIIHGHYNTKSISAVT